MNFSNKNMLLYAVTDRAWETDEYKLENQVLDALKGGVTCIQLREKNADFDEFLDIANNIKKLCESYDVPFLINDNIKIAIASNATGVHIGQSDMNSKLVREKLGENKIIGVTVNNLEEAKEAVLNGADYLGVGAVFSTSTKLDVDVISHETVREICENINIPVVAIGGINYDNIDNLKGFNLSGIALVSEIFAKKDIENHSKKLLEKSKEVFERKN